ncbi:MAG: NAD(+)/NADH kinase [Oscillospiraceae bacterium]|nr:NAD(+)/NADH kinase [Oscillospiraceae bacterium]
MKKVILCPNPHRDHELRAAKQAKTILEECGFQTAVCLPFYTDENTETYGLSVAPLQQELREAEMLIAFGGDGTILHLAKNTAVRDVPILGVNLGSLGFMAELEQNELVRLRELRDGKFTTEERMMLDISVVREGRVIYSNAALNEAVVTKGAVSRIIRLSILTEQGRLLDVSGDGVIVATPTGSTGYSLSAGGPVVEPTAENIIISPICAHSIHANSYVLSSKRSVTVRTGSTGRKQVYLSVDGGRAFLLRSGDEVMVVKSQHVTRLIRLSNKNFCDILAKKMLPGGLNNEN